MNSEHFALLFVLIVLLAKSDRAQRVVLAIVHEILKVTIMAWSFLCIVGVYAPTWIPQSTRDLWVAWGLVQPDQITQHSFWLMWGSVFSASGILLIILISHLRSLLRIDQHLNDVESLVKRVSSQIPSTHKYPSEQGTLQNAVEMMAEYFRKR